MGDRMANSSMLTVLFALVATTQATSPLFPGCPVRNMYLPCRCDVMWQQQSLELTCSNVTVETLQAIVQVAINNNHSFSELTYKSEEVTELPDGLFDGVYLRKLQLDLPNLVNLSAQVFSGQEENLESLLVEASKLSSIPIEALSSLEALKEFKLHKTPLYPRLTNETFARLSTIENITLISLSNNGIEEIQDGTFSGFVNLEYLLLDDNPVTEFRVRSLPEHKVKSLSLSGMPLEKFPISAVSKVEASGWLSLERMNITTVTPGQLEAFIMYGVLGNLRDNPLDCNCDFRRIAKRLEVKPYDYDVIGKCDKPESLHGANIFTLRPEHFAEC